MKQDFRNTKIRIKSEEHSKAFQEAVFAAGGCWGSGENIHEICKANEPYLFVSHSLKLGWADSPSYFSCHEYKEIQFPLPTKGHIHAESMAQYAEDAKTHAEPWKLWQIKGDDGVWGDCNAHPRWANATEYRRKTKTHIVNGVEIPDLRVSPEYGDYYYLANPASRTLFTGRKFDGDDLDKICVGRGLTYQDTEEGKQAAILHSQAMLGIAWYCLLKPCTLNSHLV